MQSVDEVQQRIAAMLDSFERHDQRGMVVISTPTPDFFDMDGIANPRDGREALCLAMSAFDVIADACEKNGALVAAQFLRAERKRILDNFPEDEDDAA